VTDVRGRALDYLSIAVAATLWGTWSLFLRAAPIDARWSTPIVFGTMSLLGAPLLLRRGARSPGAHSASEWRWLIALGFGDAFNAGFFFLAMTRTTVPIAVLSHYLAPALIALTAPKMLDTPPQRHALTRALIATAGLVSVLEPWKAASVTGRHLVGAAFGAVSAVFYALNVSVTKRLARSFTAEEQLVFHSAVAALVPLVVAPWSAPPSPRAVGFAVAGGVVVGITAAMLFVRGIAKVPAEHASLLTFLEPLTAVAIGTLVFHEHLGPFALVGAAVVLLTGVSAVRQGAG
jgi:drug/metabolite transporter (DMT)-like permease